MDSRDDECLVSGFITIEENLRGLGLRELEDILGFPNSYLCCGARIVIIDEKAVRGSFLFLGSTFYPAQPNEDRSSVTSDLKVEPKAYVPGAWLGRRLAQVQRLHKRTERREFPRAMTTRTEQWFIPAGFEVQAVGYCLVYPGRKYLGPRYMTSCKSSEVAP